MNNDKLQELLLKRFNLKIGPKMSEYVAGQFQTGGKDIAVIGGDARTGVPRRQMISMRAIADEMK